MCQDYVNVRVTNVEIIHFAYPKDLQVYVADALHLASCCINHINAAINLHFQQYATVLAVSSGLLIVIPIHNSGTTPIKSNRPF